MGGPDHTRVVLDLSGPVTHSLFTLHNPERVVIDMADASLVAARNAPTGQGLVRQVRFGPRDDGSLRVVLDITATCSRRVRGGSQRDLWSSPGGRSGADGGAGARQDRTCARPTARDLVVAVDAGHGGDDPGAIGRGGTREKDVTLAIARALAQQIDREPGMQRRPHPRQRLLRAAPRPHAQGA